MNTNNSTDTDEKQPLTARQLGELYPKAKTYDELEQRQLAAEKERLKRRPKFVLVSAGLIIASVLTVLLGVHKLAEATLSTLGAMAGVFTLFFVGVILFGLIVWQVQRINGFFADRSLASSWFVWLYIFSGSIAAWAYTVFSPHDGWSMRLIFAAIHLGFMLLVGGLYLNIVKK